VDDPLVSVSYITKECVKNHEFASLFARKCGRKVLHTGSKLAPNNSIPAFRIAGERGVFGIELDPNLTKDGEIVMSHEPTIKGAYNYYGDLTIADMTLSELRQYRIITDGSYADEELVIPTIEDTLQICRQYDMLCILDVKVFSNISVFCNKMMDAIYRYNMQNAVIVLCWNNDLLKYVKNKYPSIAISTYGHISDFDDNTENVVISTEYTDSIKDSIKEWHSKGYLVNLFTASSVEDEKKMKEALADMITTDITPEA
jgi:glycerophosphoryl diester phosphodiesterase